MLVRGFVRTIKDGTPVPDGTEVRFYLHDTNALLATTVTAGGEYEYNFQGNPGPYWTEVEVANEVHLSSSKVVGMAGPVNISGLPLLFNLWHDGYIPDLLDELEVASSGVGMSVSAAGGAGLVRGVLYDQSDPLPLPIAPASTQNRIDTVVLQVVPAFANDNTEGRARILVKQGVASSSPVPPGLTQDSDLWEMPLADVVVDAGVSSIAENKVVDRRVPANVKISDGYLSTDMFADDSVTGDKLADGAVTEPKLGDESVVSRVLANLAVATEKIADGAVTAAKLAASAVTESKIADGAVTASKIASRAVTGSKIGLGVIQSGHIEDGQITNSKLASNSVTGAKILSATIAGSKLANSAVTSVKLAANAVTNSKISNSAVSESKLDSAVRTKLNAPGYTEPTRYFRSSHSKNSYSTNANLIGDRIGLHAGGTYHWFAIGFARVTGENSSPLVKGWLRITMDGAEQSAVPFHVPGGYSPYGGSVQVVATGTTTGGWRDFQLNWKRDSGTMTVNSRQLMVWFQRV